MKKIIVFTDTEDLEKYYWSQLEAGSKDNPDNPRIYGHCSDMRRAELITPEGYNVELVFLNIQYGDLLLSNRKAEIVDVSRAEDALAMINQSLLKLTLDIQSDCQPELEMR